MGVEGGGVCPGRSRACTGPSGAGALAEVGRFPFWWWACLKGRGGVGERRSEDPCRAPCGGFCLLGCMPVGFLTDEQVAAYGRCTGPVPRADLDRFFFLNDAGRALITSTGSAPCGAPCTWTPLASFRFEGCPACGEDVVCLWALALTSTCTAVTRACFRNGQRREVTRPRGRGLASAATADHWSVGLRGRTGAEQLAGPWWSAVASPATTAGERVRRGVPSSRRGGGVRSGLA